MGRALPGCDRNGGDSECLLIHSAIPVRFRRRGESFEPPDSPGKKAGPAQEEQEDKEPMGDAEKETRLRN